MIRTILKWTAWITASLALLLLIAYWTSPYWVPAQMAKFLPQSIKLESLEFEHPGLTRTKVKKLTLQIDRPNKLAIELRDTELHYSLWQQKLIRVSAESAIIQLSKSADKTDDKPFQLPEQINIPQLPVNQLSIDNLELQGIAGQNFQLSNIQYKAKGQQLELSSNVMWMGLSFILASKMTHQNQVLNALNLTLQQDNNRLALRASPSSDSNWRVGIEGEIQKFPLVQIYSAEFDTISFDLTADIKQTSEQQLLFNLKQDSTLSIPVRFNSSWFEQEVTNYTTPFGLTIDTPQLNKQLQVILNAKEDTQFVYGISSKTLTSIGKLELIAKNNNLNGVVELSTFNLNLLKTLAAPEQSLSSQITADVTLPTVSYQSTDRNLTINTNSLRSSLSGDLTFQDGSFAFKTQKLNLTPTNSAVKSKSYSANLPTHEWQGSINWIQQLTNKLGEQETNEATVTRDRIIKLKLVKPVNVKLALTDNTVDVTQLIAQLELNNDNFKAHYSAAELAFLTHPLKLRDVKGSLSPDPTNAAINGTLNFNQASYLSDKVAVDYVSGRFDWKLLKQTFTAKGELQHSKNTIPVRYVYSLQTGAHDLQLDRSSLPIMTLKSWTPLLKSYPALQVTAGDLNIKKLKGDPLKLLFEGAVSVDGLNLLYDKLVLSNATITDNLSKQSSLQGSINGKVDSIELAAGIAITDLTFKLQHTATDYRFQDIKGHLLGGTISIPLFDMHKTTIKPFTLLLSNINLQTLLSAIESEKLSVSSNFDIILPLIINPGSRQITNGTFISKKPGILKLTYGGGKESNIAFQALENFHYKELSGTIDYSSEGDYIITLYTLGANPNLYNGFPIKLELTLRGNLPNLLYSMLITGDMATPVLDDLKQKQLLKIQ